MTTSIGIKKGVILCSRVQLGMPMKDVGDIASNRQHNTNDGKLHNFKHRYRSCYSDVVSIILKKMIIHYKFRIK